MSRLLLLVLLTYAALAIEPCIIQDKKAKSNTGKIHVIELDDSQENSGESEIVALHLSNRRRREVDSRLDRKGSCKTDEDCGPGAVCFARLFCVKGRRRSESSN